MAEDSDYSSVVMLLDGESLLDYKLHTMTAHGNCVVSSAQAKFGTQSIAFDGTGDYLDTPDSADWNFGSGDFTIEFHAYLASTSTVYALIGQWVSGQRNFIVYHEAGNVQFSFTTNGSASTNAVLSASGCSANTWHHFAFSRNGADFKAFIDGVQKGATYNIASSTLFNSTSTLELGVSENGTYGALSGYLDNVRITKGYARYTANFTPPTEAFPTTGLEETVSDTVALADDANNINILYNGLYGFSLVDAAVADDPTQLDLYIIGPNEAVTAADAATHEVIQWFYESIAANAAISSSNVRNLSYADQVAASDTLVALFNQLVAESAETSETWYLDTASMIVEVALATGITTSQIAAVQALAEVIVVLELQQAGKLETIAENVALAAVASNLIRATQAILEQAIAADTQVSYLILLNAVSETVQTGEAITLWQSLTQAIEEGATAFVHLNVGGEVYTGWVLNTQSNAVTEYQGLNFNSLCKIGTRYFGATESGLYELAGATDAGTSIATYIQGGILDFGTASVKNTQYAYIAMDANGAVFFGVSVPSGSQNEHRWYKIEVDAGAVGSSRVKLGSGVRSRYWRFSVASDALQAFEAMTVVPVVLTRRV